MSFMNQMLSAASMGEADRLDATLRELEQLQSRFDGLVGLLQAKGLLTADELVPFVGQEAVTDEELDRLDVNADR
jgi:hypothetical protein